MASKARILQYSAIMFLPQPTDSFIEINQRVHVTNNKSTWSGWTFTNPQKSVVVIGEAFCGVFEFAEFQPEAVFSIIIHLGKTRSEYNMRAFCLPKILW